jgi:small subunit ribosomal protein S8
MQDQLSDMFTRIRNAHAVYKLQVQVSSSKLKLSVCKVLLTEGYIGGYEEVVDEKGGHKIISIQLKYYQEKPVIEMLRRVSKPSLRVYCKHNELPSVNENLGIAIVSTNQGVMSSIKARAAGLGGEVLCVVF